MENRCPVSISHPQTVHLMEIVLHPLGAGQDDSRTKTLLGRGPWNSAKNITLVYVIEAKNL